MSVEASSETSKVLLIVKIFKAGKFSHPLLFLHSLVLVQVLPQPQSQALCVPFLLFYFSHFALLAFLLIIAFLIL